MIDLATEDLIPISQVPERLPRRPNGRKIHISCVYRWMLHGLQGGRIRLETIKVGGSTFSSTQAIQRFADALTGCHNEPATPISRMSRSRQAQAALAARQVRQQLGIKQPSSASKDGIEQHRRAAQHVGDDLATQESSSATNSASTPSSSRKAESRLVHAPCGANSQQPQAQQQQQVDQFTGSKPAADTASKGTST
jgi:hypothetical protein